jgi:RNA polymerase sigma factor (sigma-70 family)
VNFDEIADGSLRRGEELIAVDDALTALAQFDPRKAHIVELRFFGGLSVEEVAQVLRVSAQTVMRDWKLARVWLMRELAK